MILLRPNSPELVSVAFGPRVFIIVTRKCLKRSVVLWEAPGLTGFLAGERRAVSDTDKQRHSRHCARIAAGKGMSIYHGCQGTLETLSLRGCWWN